MQLVDYEYKCPDCGNIFKEKVPFAHGGKVKCPRCQNKLDYSNKYFGENRGTLLIKGNGFAKESQLR